MSLAPYKVTALKRIDTNGINIIANAEVTIYDSGSGIATIAENEEGDPKSNPFNCDLNGEAQIWIEEGIYTITVTGGQSAIVKI